MPEKEIKELKLQTFEKLNQQNLNNLTMNTTENLIYLHTKDYNKVSNIHL